jgi:hypothetical protein
MAAEIRVDRITSRAGINTIDFTGDGFSFLTNVGVGTTNIAAAANASNTQKLNVGIVTANQAFIGVITGATSVQATRYYGDGSSLSNIISGVGIQSAGNVIGYGFTTLNFVGSGSTFSVNGNTVNISIAGGTSEIKTIVQTTNATGVGSFATATYRSAGVLAQINQGTQYQVGRYLMIHDGTTVTVVEQAAVSTGSSMLGSFAGSISGTNAELRVTMVSSGIATITTKIDTITV